jgi:hypothetical protein
MVSVPGHPSEDVVFRYVADQPSDEERLEVDLHMADCDACRQKVQAMLHLRTDFDAIWQSCTAAEFGRTYRQWRIAEALRARAAESPALVHRATEWLRRKATNVGVELRVFVDGARRIASAAAQMPSGCAIELQMAYAGVGSPEEITRLKQHLQRSSEFLLQGRPEETARELLQAVRIDARCPQAAVAEILHEGKRVLYVIADSRRGRISVKAEDAPGWSAPSLAILLSASAEVPPRIAEFVSVEGETSTLAEFDDVKDGVYGIEMDCD